MADDQLISIEEPFPDETPAPELDATDEPEPDGVVEITPGRRMVDVSVVAAERKRARELAEKTIREKELAPLQEKANRADALQQALDTVTPYLEQIKQHAQQQPRQPEPVEQVSDDEAAQEARDLQLYNKDSQLDIATAKKIILRRRSEAKAAAVEAAKEAITPLEARTAKELSAKNFEKHAQALVGPDGQLMADPQVVVDLWKSLPPELTQHDEVAQIVMDAALGRSQRTKNRGRTVPPPQRAPILSESPGGGTSDTITLSERARKMDLTKADLQASAKHFKPGETSAVGDW